MTSNNDKTVPSTIEATVAKLEADLETAIKTFGAKSVQAQQAADALGKAGDALLALAGKRANAASTTGG